jgi:hypothetical protein
MNSSFIGRYITSSPPTLKSAQGRAHMSVLQFAYFRLTPAEFARKQANREQKDAVNFQV